MLLPLLPSLSPGIEVWVVQSRRVEVVELVLLLQGQQLLPEVGGSSISYILRKYYIFYFYISHL